MIRHFLLDLGDYALHAFALGPSSVDAVPSAVETQTKIMKTASAD